MELFIYKDGRKIGPSTKKAAMTKVGVGAFDEPDFALAQGRTDLLPARRQMRRQDEAPSPPPRSSQCSRRVPTPKVVSGQNPAKAVSRPKAATTSRPLRSSPFGLVTRHPIYAAVALLQIACVLMVCSAPPVAYLPFIIGALAPIALVIWARQYWLGYGVTAAVIFVPMILWTGWISPRNERLTAAADEAEMDRRAEELRQQREAEDKAAIQEEIAEAAEQNRTKEARAIAETALAQQQAELKKVLAKGEAQIHRHGVMAEQDPVARDHEHIAQAVAQQEVKEAQAMAVVRVAETQAERQREAAAGPLQEALEEQDRLAREKERADAESRTHQDQGNIEARARERLIDLKAEPDVVMSKQARSLGVVISCAGEKLARFQELQGKRDWWGWLEEFSGEHYSQAPDLRRPIGDVDSAVQHTLQMDLVLNMKAQGDPRAIRVLAAPKLDQIKCTEFPIIFNVMAEWKRGSDGVTYSYPANASDGRIVILVARGNYLQDLLGQAVTVQVRAARGNAAAIPVAAEADAACPAGAELRRMKTGFEQSLNAIRQEKELFKLSAEEAEQKCRQLQMRVQKAMLGFVDRY